MSAETTVEQRGLVGELADDAGELQNAIFSLRVTRSLEEFKSGLDDVIGWAEVLTDNLLKLRDAAKAAL